MLERTVVDGVSADPDEDPHIVASHLTLVRDWSTDQGFQFYSLHAR